MGMKFTNHIANRTGRFFIFRRRLEPELTHSVDNPPLHRLKPIANIWQCPIKDHIHGVVKVCLFRITA